jgi:hypothetical protein
MNYFEIIDEDIIIRWRHIVIVQIMLSNTTLTIAMLFATLQQGVRGVSQIVSITARLCTIELVHHVHPVAIVFLFPGREIG